MKLSAKDSNRVSNTNTPENFEIPMIGDANQPDESPTYQDPPVLDAACFLTFRAVWYDGRQPERGIGIGGIYTHYELRS